MTSVVYDLSRLSTRVLNATPNGIDWIDRLLADHFLPRRTTSTLLFGPFGPRLFAPGEVQNPTAALASQWDGPAAIPEELIEALLQPIAPGRTAPRLEFAAPGRTGRIAAALGRYGLRSGAAPASAAPQGAIYLNATHYPLESPRHTGWLDARADVRPVFVIHDLLPVVSPETFWRGEPERHARRLALLARRGAGAIVLTRAVETDLRAHLAKVGRTNLPILCAQPPVAPIFRKACAPEPRLTSVSYFVACGTIEPRKNHLLLIDVWRRLVAELGPAAPRLVVVGKRGWRTEEIIEGLSDPALGGAMIEAAGLSNGGWRALLAGAQALLAPSLAEGYGLPLAEALAAGAPALCSDIPPFHEIAGGASCYLDPGNPTDWAERIKALCASAETRAQALAAAQGHPSIQPDAWFAEIDAFLERICATAAD